jgi:hypothetical protein
MVVRASRPLIGRGDESMTDPDLPTRTEDEGATLDLPAGVGGFAPGQVLGERYRVLELLGRGGMGEVWHAIDLKLRVEVVLNAHWENLFTCGRRLQDRGGPFPGWAVVLGW